MTQKYQLFLASSAELKEDRQQFEIFISHKNKAWHDQGIFLELVVWEDFLDAMSKTRLQDEYNQAIRQCDLFIMLFFTKVGQYTEEEFETAFGHFQKTNKPLIYTYFKDAPISTGDLHEDFLTLLQFKKKLGNLEHFYTVYKNTDELLRKFAEQLDKLAAEGFIALQKDPTTAQASIQQSHSGTGDNVAGNQTKIGRQITMGANSTYTENSKD